MATNKVVFMPESRATRSADPMEQLREQLLHAFHIIDLSGQPSGMGSHMTARLPGEDRMLFHIHNYGFGEVTPDHIFTSDFDLNVLDANGAEVAVNPTLHIHTRIYRMRPDVNCIVHTHAKHVTALSCLGQNLACITQSSSRLYNECVYFAEEGSVLGKDKAQALADALGGNSAMVLKNHGLLTAGRSIPEAVLLALVMEQEAEIQLMAMGAGTISPLGEEGAMRSKEYLRSDKMMGRHWAFQMRKLARLRPEVLEM
jgi:L-fuculose-phosphate aldolase